MGTLLRCCSRNWTKGSNPLLPAKYNIEFLVQTQTGIFIFIYKYARGGNRATRYIIYADVVKLVNTLDLESSATSLGVQVPSSAPI